MVTPPPSPKHWYQTNVYWRDLVLDAVPPSPPTPPGREDDDANHILVKIVLVAHHIGVGKSMPGKSGEEEKRRRGAVTSNNKKRIHHYFHCGALASIRNSGNVEATHHC